MYSCFKLGFYSRLGIPNNREVPGLEPLIKAAYEKLADEGIKRLPKQIIDSNIAFNQDQPEKVYPYLMDRDDPKKFVWPISESDVLGTPLAQPGMTKEVYDVVNSPNKPLSEKYPFLSRPSTLLFGGSLASLAAKPNSLFRKIVSHPATSWSTSATFAAPSGYQAGSRLVENLGGGEAARTAGGLAGAAGATATSELGGRYIMKKFLGNAANATTKAKWLGTIGSFLPGGLISGMGTYMNHRAGQDVNNLSNQTRKADIAAALKHYQGLSEPDQFEFRNNFYQNPNFPAFFETLLDPELKSDTAKNKAKTFFSASSPEQQNLVLSKLPENYKSFLTEKTDPINLNSQTTQRAGMGTLPMGN
jgi:hypothetical protein